MNAPKSIVGIAILSIVSFACGDDDRAPRDSAGTDGGSAPDAAMDALVRSDAGDSGPLDANPPDASLPDGGTDTGPPLVCSPPGPGGDCVLRVPLGTFGPLTDACMPRCSAATAATYRACEAQSCRNAAVDADTVPGIEYFIGSARVRSPPMDCATCVGYQEFHCFSLVCTDEVDAYVDNCIAGVRPELCDSSIAAVDDCLARLTPTEQSTVAACMESADGPPGCFACE